MFLDKRKYLKEKLDLSDLNKGVENDKLIHLELRKINNHDSVDRHDSIKLLKFLSKKFNKTSNKINHKELDKIFHSNLFPKKKYFTPKKKVKKKLTPFQIIMNENEENKKITELKQNNSLRKLNLVLQSYNNNYLNYQKENNFSIPSIHPNRINPYFNYQSFSHHKKIKNTFRTLSVSLSKNSTSLEQKYENKKKEFESLKLRNNKGFNSVNFNFNLNPLNYHIIHRNKNKVNAFTEI